MTPRGVEARIAWLLNHRPSGPGMCAQHTWHALGGDYGCPPAWGCANANEVISKVRASGRYRTPTSWDGPPPRGAWVGYRYGAHGHACLSLGDGRIATTDPTGKPGGVGIESLFYPNKWGANGWTVWTDQYNGVRFPVEESIVGWNVGTEKVTEIASRTLKDGVYNEVGRITLPGGGDYLLTLQGRLEAGAYARVQFVRLGWPGLESRDNTGNDAWTPPDGAATSFTHNHAIAGGGPVAWEIKPYGVGDTTVVTSIVVKALRVT